MGEHENVLPTGGVRLRKELRMLILIMFEEALASREIKRAVELSSIMTPEVKDAARSIWVSGQQIGLYPIFNVCPF